MRPRHDEIATLAATHEVGGKAPARIQFRVGLGDGEPFFGLCRQVHHRLVDLAIRNLAVGTFDKAVLIDPRVGRQRIDQADVRALGRLDGAHPAIVGGVNVAHLEAGALARQAARSERRQTTLVGDLRQGIGLVHELAELAGAKKLAHRRGRRLGVDQVVRHHGIDLDRTHALADRALHAQEADAVLVHHELADGANAAVTQVIDVVDVAAAVLEIDERLDDRQNVFLAQDAHRFVDLEAKAGVHLDAPHRRQVVAFRIEEQALEQVLRRLFGRRFARPHHPIDFDEGALAVRHFVRDHGVADIRAHRNMIDVQGLDFGHARLFEGGHAFLGEFFAGLDKNLARRFVDNVAGRITASDLDRRHQHFFNFGARQFADDGAGDLGAVFDDDPPALGVDEVARRLEAAHPLGGEACFPTAFGIAHVGDGVIEVVENILVRHFERVQQRRRRQFAPAVDADVKNVLGVELEVEPRAAVGNDARRKQELARRMGFALVVVEKDAWRAVHLADDDALGSVDDERPVFRHQRHVAHVDVLFLDIEDRARGGVLIDFEDDQAQRHLQGRGICHVTLLALVGVVFRIFQLVLDEMQFRRFREILDRKYRLEHALQAGIGARVGRHTHLQEIIVGAFLHLDQIRHGDSRGNPSKIFANSLTTGEGQRHSRSFSNVYRLARAAQGRRPGEQRRAEALQRRRPAETAGPMLRPFVRLAARHEAPADLADFDRGPGAFELCFHFSQLFFFKCGP